MEDQARDILRTALAGQEQQPANLAASIRARIAATGGVQLDIAPREALPKPPDFSK